LFDSFFFSTANYPLAKSGTLAFFSILADVKVALSSKWSLGAIHDLFVGIGHNQILPAAQDVSNASDFQHRDANDHVLLETN
jgi:hypothetical protein